MTLTRYYPGSFRELWSISYPLMVSYFCWIMMFFVDRLFLAFYSQDAFNAAVNGAILSWTFIEGANFIASMAEVFVAQYNGSNQKDMVAAPSWQMIWFSLLSAFFFIPIGIWGGEAIYSTFYEAKNYTLEKTYFEWIMLFGVAYPFASALSSFYLGRGQTKLLIWVAVISNFSNITLDYLFIFGIPGFIPSMGVQGAAIATGISQTLYALILLCFFLNKKMDEEYQTRTPRFIPDLFKRCIKLGSTFAFSYTLELAGISLFYLLMSKISTDHMTIAGICQTVLIFLSFCGESLMKALIAITGNLIGAKKWDTIRTALYTSIKTYLVFCGLIAFPLLIYPHIVTDIFLTAQHWANDLALSADSNIDLTQLKDLVALSIRYVFIYLVFKGLAWQVSAVLIASGDTRFLALVNPILLWFCFIGPVYICVYLPKLGPEQGWMISAYYSVILLTCYLARYYQGKWKKGNLVESFSPEA